MRNPLIAGLVAGLMATASNADEPRCKEGRFCTLPAQPGNSLMNSRVQVRAADNLPRNTEMRLPDEVLVITDSAEETADIQEEVVFDESTVVETKPVNERSGGINYPSGEDFLSADERNQLQSLAARLAGKSNLRLSIIGHADEQRLSARKKAIYGDNRGLSEARAKAAADYLLGQAGLAGVPMLTSGKGDSEPLVKCDKKQGIRQYQACLAPNRRVEIQVWYDQVSERTEQVARTVPAPAEALLPVGKPECAKAKGADSGLPFRISIDGEPLAEKDAPNSADVTRCVDVALAQADIQMKYDPLNVAPALNVWSWPSTVARGKKVEFHAYTNYSAWVRRAEIRIFAKDQPTQGTPLAVLPYDWAQPAVWVPPADAPAEMLVLLRVYDELERFDETAAKPLNLTDIARPPADTEKAERERLVGWGEDSRRLANIPVSGGAVTVSGEKLRPGESALVLGQSVPVDKHGKFAVRQILPAGPHEVDIRVQDGEGSGNHYSRHINIADRDWFYVAVGDLTVGQNNTSGPARLVTGDTQHYDDSLYLDGRGAFYLKGKIKGDMLLTASADTREQPLQNLFSNFGAKDPRYLIRRIDPDRYYPVYGDDSTTTDDAPTQGKFYVRLDRGDDHVLWGNFQTQWTGTELTQFSRALYGADALWKSDATTQYGEKRATVNAFAAEPGTLGAREEFRGTGGSLYYLQHQDITQGSERVWVEIRDKDSGLVLERKQLVPVQDYDLNMIQGRILLRAPLSSTADGSTTLIQTSSLNGNSVHLVVTYEYAPSLTALADLAYGLRAETWVNDHVRIGATGYKQGNSAQDQKLGGVDATLRYKPGTWIKMETARSNGAGAGDLLSLNGGFNFSNRTVVGDTSAEAKRLEAQIELGEVWQDAKGKGSFYWQDRDRGFSAPGQATGGEQISQYGGRFNLPITDTSQVEVKGDQRDSDTQSSTAVEANVRTQIAPEWTVGLGVRADNRNVAVANASPTLSQDGHRTDAIARLEYKPLKEAGEDTPPEQVGKPKNWDIYGYAQGTVENSAGREPNDRGGAGFNWRINDRIKVTGEASGGNTGTGGKFGADYSFDDRSNGYMTYTLETDRADASTRGRQGILTTGSKYRMNDEMTLYGENRKTHGTGAESMTNAFGVDLAPNDRWSHGIKLEIGSIADPNAGELKRRGISLNTSYKFEKIKYSGALEYRKEDGTAGSRQSWLVRNSGGYQVDPDWRLIGKLNFAISNGGDSNLPDADFIELVAGAAWRPVKNDRWNTLFKYTFFRDLPSPGQLSSNGVAADYSQKSHVLSVDTIYDLKPWLSVGGKYGLRVGELKTSKTDGEWFSSQAQLLVLRADWHWVKEWDAIAEARLLKAREAQDQKAGFLVGVYRHMNEHFKLGAGYNFTDFSDDLTDLSYSSHGWFVNLLGTY
jgi:outer membrane protein OmpA-like peptidoglycan-associated protein